MLVYLINIILLLIFGFIFLLKNPTQQNKKIFCFFASLNWIILSGVRHISIGADTYAYKVFNFDVTKYKTWGNLFRDFIDIYFKGVKGKDPGYQIFEKIIQIFTTNYQVYLVIIALIFTIPLGIWIYRNSKECLMSFLLYSCMFYSFFAITGIRQTIATALVVLIGYNFIKKRNFWAFVFITLIAFTIHKSVICFFPFYFIANKKITKKYIYVMLGIIICAFIFRSRIMVVLGTLTGYEDYINQYKGAGTWNFTALLIIIFIATLWKAKPMLLNNPKSLHYINAIFIAMLFTPLTYIDPSAMRVVQYYSIFIMLLIPEIISTLNKKEKMFVYPFAVVILFLLFIKTNPQYLFFWQGV